MHNVKKALQKTFLYTLVYLKIVKYYRIIKRKVHKFFSKIKKRVKKFIKGKWNVIYRHYILKILYPRIYKKYSKLPVDEKKVVFVGLSIIVICRT